MSVVVKVTGIPDLAERLKKLGAAAEARASREIQAHALRVRDAARTEAPKDEGDLEESIQVADSEEALREHRYGMTPGEIKAAVGSTLFYAAYQHFGLKSRGIRPNPFLFRPFEAGRHDLLVRLDRAMKEEGRAA